MNTRDHLVHIAVNMSVRTQDHTTNVDNLNGVNRYIEGLDIEMQGKLRLELYASKMKLQRCKDCRLMRKLEHYPRTETEGDTIYKRLLYLANKSGTYKPTTSDFCRRCEQRLHKRDGKPTL